jgi:hypothetical protein
MKRAGFGAGLALLLVLQARLYAILKNRRAPTQWPKRATFVALQCHPAVMARMMGKIQAEMK